MKTILFLIVISVMSTPNTYLCKTDSGQKGVVVTSGIYQKGDTIWLNNSNSK